MALPVVLCSSSSMKKVLDSHLETVIQNRVTIAHEIKLYTLESLAKEWHISIATLRRYHSLQEREKSRSAAKIYRTHTKRSGNACQICGLLLKTHPRCPICTQLTHEYSIHTHLH